MKLNSIKAQLIIFLTALALFLSLKDKELFSFFTAFVAVASAVAFDSFVSYFKTKKFTFNESAVISGLIIGFVVSSDEPLWIFLVASLFAIGSKYLLRFGNKHVFNPAAFGIFITSILFGAATQWRGTYLWYILMPGGLYFIYKIRKFEVLLGYLVASWGLFAIQAVMQKTPLLNIFGYLSYFYIFIMVIEPRTTPLKSTGKLIFGVAVASLIFIFTEMGVKFDAELCALLIANISVPLLNKIPERRL
jgi:Na+-translocating ferredoxin:NAD+ oxidoreductase RnfD subunit